jgi:hypothetical protein
MNDEKLKSHMQQLKHKHVDLQEKINKLIHLRGPEDELVRLKKEKLKIKDELENFERKLS